jgi:chemotaxis receptor (MCP) glutamine deamidase CheD
MIRINKGLHYCPAEKRPVHFQLMGGSELFRTESEFSQIGNKAVFEEGSISRKFSLDN